MLQEKINKNILRITNKITTMIEISNLVNRKYKLQQKASMMLWKIDASDVIMMESRCSAEASQVRDLD